MAQGYRAAIVGLSGIAANPAKPASHPALGRRAPSTLAAAFAAVPATEIVAACDLVSQRCEEFRARWQQRWPRVQTYTDFRQMLAEQPIDILAVATPDHRHADIVVAAAGAGVRGILCEKPLATNLADADRMIATCAAAGITLIVDHTRRWMPQWNEARELIRAGAIGEVTQVIGILGGPRAMLFRNGTHWIDMMNFFADAEPAEVVAELEPEMAGYGPVYRGDGGTDPGSDPGANIYITYRNGVRGYFCGMKNTVLHREVTAIGTRGYVRVDDRRGEVVTHDGNQLWSRPITYQDCTSTWVQGCLADLIGALESGRPTNSTPAEARRALAIIVAALESSHQGKTPVACR